MSKLLIASLVGLVTSTLFATTEAHSRANASQPIPNATLAYAACKPSGKIVFQIDRRTDAPDRSPTSRLTVDSNGAWSFVETAAGGKRVRRANGCLAHTELERVKKSVASATWKTRQADIACMAFSADYTEYRAAGKLVLTRRLCDAVILDDKTSASMQQLTAILGSLGRTT